MERLQHRVLLRLFGVCSAAHYISNNIKSIHLTGHMIISDKNSVLQWTLQSTESDAMEAYLVKLVPAVMGTIFHDQLTSPSRVLF